MSEPRKYKTDPFIFSSSERPGGVYGSSAKIPGDYFFLCLVERLEALVDEVAKLRDAVDVLSVSQILCHKNPKEEA